jgi:hypothetical protein
VHAEFIVRCLGQAYWALSWSLLCYSNKIPKAGYFVKRFIWLMILVAGRSTRNSMVLLPGKGSWPWLCHNMAERQIGT